MGQANATLLEFPCGAVLVDAGAQDEEKVDELVGFLNDFFARRPDLGRTLESIIITHNHIDLTRALKAIVGNENIKVERYIDHGMRERPGTGNPNWVREEKAEGNLDITRSTGSSRDTRRVRCSTWMSMVQVLFLPAPHEPRYRSRASGTGDWDQAF